MFQRTLFGLLLLAAAASACSPRSGPASAAAGPPAGTAVQQAVRRVDDQIFIVGDLNPEIAAEFTRELVPGVTTLVITSGGGNSPGAVAIARAVHEHGLKVIVSKACMSGCAQFVFAAARERVILPDSLVVFHNTRSSIARLGAQNRSPQSDDFQRAADADAALEQNLYRTLGLPQTWLYQPQLEVRTQCVRYALNPQAHARDLEFKSFYVGWIPTRRLMMSSGLAFTGFWPDDNQMLEHAFNVVFRKDLPFHIISGGADALMPAAEVDAAFSKIGVCDGAPRQ